MPKAMEEIVGRVSRKSRNVGRGKDLSGIIVLLAIIVGIVLPAIVSMI